MVSLEFNQNLCRICLEQKLILSNWNDEVLEFGGKTYKDCYYKYTQLEELVLDPFSPTLCEVCSTDLKNAHMLVKKALESYKILQEILSSATQRCEQKHEDKIRVKPLVDIKHEPAEFEMLLFEQSMDPVVIDVQNVEEGVEMSHIETKKHIIADFRKVVEIPPNETKVKLKRVTCKLLRTRSKRLSPQNMSEDETNQSLISSFDSLSQDGECETIESKKKESYKKANNKDEETPKKRRKKELSKKKVKTKTASKIHLKDEAGDQVEISDRGVTKNKVGMCSYCSRIIRGIASLKAHEETHKEHRERAVTCAVCGLKLYDKKNLNAHMKVHAENRERSYKCDFCEKAFFNRGTLNIHRRIHLGQMKSCPLCSKQYFRQIDLDKHMNSHSATPINTDVKKRSRYFVYCKDCNKSMLSSSWKAHEAVHKNEPLMKCSICDKDFFCRKSCVTHMKKVHHKSSREDYDKFIVTNGSRLSRLMLEQQEKIQPTV